MPGLWIRSGAVRRPADALPRARHRFPDLSIENGVCAGAVRVTLRSMSSPASASPGAAGTGQNGTKPGAAGAAAGGPAGVGHPAAGADRRDVHVGVGHQHRQRGHPDHPERFRGDHRGSAVDRHRLLAGPRSGGAGQRLAVRQVRRHPGLQRLADRLRCRIGAVRPGLEPGKHDRLPDPAGHPGRDPAGGDADHRLPDRAPGEDRLGDGHVRAGHRGGARPSVRRWAATWSSTWTGG